MAGLCTWFTRRQPPWCRQYQISRGGKARRALTRQRLSRPWVLKNNHWSPGVAQEHARKRLSSLGVEQCEPEFGDCSWTENIFFPVGQRAPIQEPCAFRSGTPCTRPQSQCHSVCVVFPCGILWCWEQEIATWSHFWSLTFPPCCTTRFRTLRLAAGSEVLFPRKVNGTTLWKQGAALIFSSCASGIDSSATRGRVSLGMVTFFLRAFQHEHLRHIQTHDWEEHNQLC